MVLYTPNTLVLKYVYRLQKVFNISWRMATVLTRLCEGCYLPQCHSLLSAVLSSLRAMNPRTRGICKDEEEIMHTYREQPVINWLRLEIRGSI